MNEMTETNRICNRHKARILKNLEDAGCPLVFKNEVISGLNWLRSDLNEMNGAKNEYTEANGNH